MYPHFVSTSQLYADVRSPSDYSLLHGPPLLYYNTGVIMKCIFPATKRLTLVKLEAY